MQTDNRKHAVRFCFSKRRLIGMLTTQCPGELEIVKLAARIMCGATTATDAELRTTARELRKMHDDKIRSASADARIDARAAEELALEIERLIGAET